MTDRFWLWLHRYAARKAQRVYRGQPKYISNYEAGVAAGRANFQRAMDERRAAEPLLPSPSTRTPGGRESAAR